MGSEEEEFEGESGAIAIEKKIPKKPQKWAVILHNDNYTTMEFVVEVLIRFFHKTQDEAMQVMIKVHTQGRGIAGVYSRDIAETKAHATIEYAKKQGHPLRCTTEPV